MQNKLGIYDEFKYAGHWWSPGNEESKVSGTIIFSKEGIKLELIGSINGLSMWEEAKEKKERNYKYPVILGECEEGPVTLINGFEINKRSGYITTSILAFNQMIIGKHIDTIEEFKINNLSLSFTNLESWLKYHPFERTYNDYGTTIVHEELFEVYVKKIDATIKSNYWISSKDELYKSVEYQYRSEIQIKTEDFRSLDSFEDIAYKLRNLFSVLMDSPVFVESMIYEEDKLNKIHIYHIPFKNYTKKNIQRHQRFHMDLPKVKPFINEIFNNWFESKLESSHLNYLTNIYDFNHMTTTDRFLNYAKAIESYHRDNSSEKGLFVNKEKYEEIVTTMISSVEEALKPDLKSKLTATLKYANEFGFQRRIKEVIRELPESLKDLVLAGQKISDMADQIRNNRDYYTHFGTKPDDLYSFDQFILVLDRLKVILLYVYLRDLGIEGVLIEESILEDYYLVENLQRAVDHFE